MARKINLSALHQSINLKGLHEQAYKFAFGKKGGMKQCYSRRYDIFTLISLNLKGEDITKGLMIERMHNGESKPLVWEYISLTFSK